MVTNDKNQKPRNRNLSMGVVLLILGGLFLLGQLFDINIGHFVWPFFIIMPGLLLFIISLVIGGTVGEWMAAFGSMVSMTGALLLYQNTFNHFESWAYAWALVVPTSIGLGKVVFGTLNGHKPSVRAGKKLATIGGVIFLVGVIFFEFIIGLSGFGLGRLHLSGYTWTLLLIGLGIFFLLRGWLQSGAATQTPTSTEAEDLTQEEARQ